MPATCSAGIDLGGTKIEATLFDRDFTPLKTRRVPTPKDSYSDLVAALLAEISWLQSEAGDADIPIGIGIPGLIDQKTGLSVTANLPANGKPLYKDLAKQIGGKLAIENDCKCFAVSEANGGAGAGSDKTFGLIIGTGLGGGVCTKGLLDKGLNGVAGEVGHMALPAHLVAEYGLPLPKCGCGRTGCFETFVSGTGMTSLAAALLGEALPADKIAQAAADGSQKHQHVRDIWLHLLAELLNAIQLTIDPDCIVLGGGVSNMPGLAGALEAKLPDVLLPSMKPPSIRIAKFGDSSGTRGAALLSTLASKRDHS